MLVQDNHVRGAQRRGCRKRTLASLLDQEALEIRDRVTLAFVFTYLSIESALC